MYCHFVQKLKRRKSIKSRVSAVTKLYHNQTVTLSNFDVLLTMHLSTTLVNDQLDAQFFYFIIRLLQSSTCFEQRRAHHQEVRLY